MSKFNTSQVSTPVRKGRTPNTTNLAGGQAYQQNAELELASLATTSFVKDSYYRSADESLTRLRELVGQVDPYFAAQAAVYVRQQDGLRSITHALTGEVAHTVHGEEWAKDFYKAVVRRPDDITEILSYYIGNYGKPLPNALKKGLGAAFGKFDEYQLAKYRGEKNALSLVDAVNLVHPRPTGKNAEALQALVKGTLKSKDTWESKVSAAGANAEAKAEAWSDLVKSGKIGYLALLRNLRNIAESKDNMVIAAIAILTDPGRIHKELIFPFQYAVAARELSNYPRIVKALSQALEISLDNVPDLGENVLIAVDHSGSMRTHAANPQLTNQEIGDIFAAALYKKGVGDVAVFGDDCGPANVGYNATDSVLTIAQAIGRSNYGHGTSFHSIFRYAQKTGKNYDTIVIFSDMQAWRTDGQLAGWDNSGYSGGYSYRNGLQYRNTSQVTNVPKNTGNADIFAFDLAGHGTSQFAQTDKKHHQLSGFSDKSIALMGQLKRDHQILVTKIKEVTFN
jgi:60 kDa SS-A/Ro ribonucleoprotein